MKQLFRVFLLLGSLGLGFFHTHNLVASGKKNPHAIFFEAERLKDTYIHSVGFVATYRLVVRNAPPEQKFIISSKNLEGVVKFVCELEADDDGQLGRQVEDGTMMLDNDNLLMFDFFKGESIEYFLESRDGKTSLSTTITPYPIRAQGLDEAEVVIRRITPDARLVLCEGDGFLPDEEVYISSQSGKDRTMNVPVVCENGRFSVLLEPEIAGKSGGLAYVDVRRSGERLILEYDWGCQATHLKKRVADTTKMKRDAIAKLPTELDD